MFAILVTIAITAGLTTIATAVFCYLYLLYPTLQQMRLYRNRVASLSEQLGHQHQFQTNLLSLQQDDLHTLRIDLIKWVEQECEHYKTPAVEGALKQRIEERLEVLAQLQKHREVLSR